MNVDVSIILATKNRAKLLEEMFESLQKAAARINYEVIVIDGNSTDNTLKVLKKYNVSKIFNEEEVLGVGRHSWPELYNFGFKQASGKWGMYASDDMIFDENCIDNAVEFLTHLGNNVAGGAFFYKNVIAEENWNEYGVDFTFGQNYLINYGLMDIEKFHSVGGLDENYKFYCADGDLCLKLINNGWVIVPIVFSKVIHNNVLDANKKINNETVQRDIDYYRKKWENTFETKVIFPRRSFFSNFIEAKNFPGILFNNKVFPQSNETLQIGNNDNNFVQNGEQQFLFNSVKKGAIVFDVGANKGNWSKVVLDNFKDIKLASFEPVPEIYGELQKNLSGYDLKLENIALSSEEGTADFYYYNEQNGRFIGLSTFYRRNNAEKDLNISPAKITVTKSTLEKYCSQNNISKINYLKVDTEGSEKDVLVGAENLIANNSIDIIQFEYGGTYLDSNITLKEVFKFLSEKKYRIFKIIPAGLIHISKWSDELESYNYSNYCAVSPLKAPHYSQVNFRSVQLDVNSVEGQKNLVKLHLGCGNKYLNGYVNIDYPPSEHTVQQNQKVDLYADIIKLNYKENSVDEIRLHHVFEHFDRFTALALLCNWHKWLKLGGKLIIETPDLEASIEQFKSQSYSYIEKQAVLRHVFGSHEAKWAVHWDGWYKEKYEYVLSALGFGNISFEFTEWKVIRNIIVISEKTKIVSIEKQKEAAKELLHESLVDETQSELRQLENWYSQFEQVLNKEEKKKYKKNVTVIFSKDRPLQLDAALNSLLTYCEDYEESDIYIIYKSTSERIQKSYRILIENNSFATFIEENTFKEDLLSVLQNYSNVLFLVDDNLFVKKFSLKNIVNILESDKNNLGFSLRLGENINYHYPSDSSQYLPELENINNIILKCDWTRGEKYFAYPLEVSSSVYRIKEIINILRDNNFYNPNTLEAALANNAWSFRTSKPELFCFHESIAFCNPVNVVQSEFENRNSGNNFYTSENLLKIFEEGKRIDISFYNGFIPASCHQEVDYVFKALKIDQLPLITIYMAVYNSEKYLRETVKSILNQTYKNFELIIVDDGSTDNSLQIITEFAEKDSRVKIISENHVGVVEARNKALLNCSAQSEYFMNHDSDDISHPRKIERLVNFLNSNKHISIVGCFAEYIDEENNFKGNPKLEWVPDVVYKTFGKFNSIVHSAALMRREVIEKLRGYRKEFPAAQDYDFFARALKAGLKLANIPEVLHKIRIHENSIGSKSKSLQSELAEKVRKDYNAFLSDKNINKIHVVTERSKSSLNIIAAVHYYYPHVGGSELVVQRIAEGLVNKGHNVTVATSISPERNFEILNGVKVKQFYVGGNFAGGFLGNDVSAYQDFLTKSNNDVLFNYAAQQWATDLAFPVVEFTKKTKVNIIAPCGYSALKNTEQVLHPEYKSYFAEIIPSVLPLYDAAVYHSKYYKDFEFAQKLGLKNSYIIPNGVDEKEFENKSKIIFREKYNITTKYYGLCVANFLEGKGHGSLINIFKEINRDDFTLVLIGKDGGQINELKTKAAGLNIKFLENINREDTVAAYHSADLFLFASEVEASPLVIIEAKASKTPFVSTDVGNVKEWKGGIVCDEKEIASKVNQLLNNYEKRLALAEEGYKEWKEKLTLSAIIDQYENLFVGLYEQKQKSIKEKSKIEIGV